MTGSFLSDLALGIAAALLLAWLTLVLALLVARPRGSLMREALRVLPDALRLLRRLGADKTLPRGVRIRTRSPSAQPCSVASCSDSSTHTSGAAR